MVESSSFLKKNAFLWLIVLIQNPAIGFILDRMGQNPMFTHYSFKMYASTTLFAAGPILLFSILQELLKLNQLDSIKKQNFFKLWLKICSIMILILSLAGQVFCWKMLPQSAESAILFALIPMYLTLMLVGLVIAPYFWMRLKPSLITKS